MCINAAATLKVSGASTYSWSPTTGLSSSLGDSLIATPTVTTTYTVLGTSTEGCTNITSLVVTVNPLPVVTAVGGNACPGDTIKLIASGAGLGTYSWKPTIGLDTTIGASVISRPLTTTTYTVTGTTVFGCKASVKVEAIIIPKPIASFTSNPQIINVLDPTVHFTDSSVGSGINKWDWSFGDVPNSTSNNQHPSFIYPDEAAEYQVELIVTDQFGCIDTVVNPLVIKGIYSFYVPNTFTPNENGVNDGFTPKGEGIDETDYELLIFDRWGNLIWRTNTWGEQWSGKANYGPEIAQIDTYVWKVHVREKDSQIVHNYIGHVNIVK
jgi:gliding motility-associated-like protein